MVGSQYDTLWLLFLQWLQGSRQGRRGEMHLGPARADFGLDHGLLHVADEVVVLLVVVYLVAFPPD